MCVGASRTSNLKPTRTSDEQSPRPEVWGVANNSGATEMRLVDYCAWDGFTNPIAQEAYHVEPASQGG